MGEYFVISNGYAFVEVYNSSVEIFYLFLFLGYVVPGLVATFLYFTYICILRDDSLFINKRLAELHDILN